MTYIDKDKALNLDFRINVSLFESRRKTAERAVQAYADAISEIPAADVRPAVKARWTDHRTNEHDGEWYCSACGEEPWWCGVTEDILPKYCPNCGAMMEES